MQMWCDVTTLVTYKHTKFPFVHWRKRLCMCVYMPCSIFFVAFQYTFIMDTMLLSAHHSTRNIFHLVDRVHSFLQCFNKLKESPAAKTSTFNRHASISIVRCLHVACACVCVCFFRYMFYALVDWPQFFSPFFFLIVYFFYTNQLRQCTHVINEQISKFVVRRLQSSSANKMENCTN